MLRKNVIIISAFLFALALAFPLSSNADKPKVTTTDEKLTTLIDMSKKLSEINARLQDISDLEQAAYEKAVAEWPTSISDPDRPKISRKKLIEAEVEAYVASILAEEFKLRDELRARKTEILKSFPELRVSLKDDSGKKMALFLHLAGSLEKEQKRTLCNKVIEIMYNNTIRYSNIPAMERPIPGFGRPEE